MLMDAEAHLQSRATPALQQHYRAGMPQLALYGLSENWLLKECAHLHWTAIARGEGRDTPEFSDPHGRRTYAALTAVRLSEARLDAVTEHAPFALLARGMSAGRAQHFSAQTVRMGSARVARIELLSALVRREQSGDNRSVVKAQSAQSAQPTPADAAPGDPALRAGATSLQQLSRLHRAGQCVEAMGLTPARAALRSAEFMPCPNNDFNGAGFLYFATFQALVDRAELAWSGVRRAVTEARELYFHGNINPGESVRVELIAAREAPDACVHWCRVVRCADGVRIADVITRKRLPA